MSLSIFASIEGNASSIVTLVPSAENIEANSTPITPPPIMARLSGTLSNLNRSSLVSTPSLSSPGIGISAGFEPTASIVCLAS